MNQRRIVGTASRCIAIRAVAGAVLAIVCISSTGVIAAAVRETEHLAAGTIKRIDPKAGTITIAHEPVSSLRWPAMTMSFRVSHPDLFAHLKEGQNVEFRFIERGSGQYVITVIGPRGK